MDKKNLVIAVSWFAFAILAREHFRLAKDFKQLFTTQKENEKMVEAAKNLVTEFQFQEIVERLEE